MEGWSRYVRRGLERLLIWLWLKSIREEGEQWIESYHYSGSQRIAVRLQLQLQKPCLVKYRDMTHEEYAAQNTQ